VCKIHITSWQEYKRGVEDWEEVEEAEKDIREAAEDAARWSAEAGGEMKSKGEAALDGACSLCTLSHDFGFF
jgi:hypothetical protein